MTGKVFEIGFPKNGTTTLFNAMRILGYRATHTLMEECSLPYEQRPGRATDLHVKWMSGRYDFDVVEEYDYIGSIFFPIFREIDAQFPGSRFILPVRDPSTWLRSMRVFAQEHLEADVSRPRELDLEALVRIKMMGAFYRNDEGFLLGLYEEHIRRVGEHFAGTGRLLEIDICGGEGWEKICGFLGVPVPAVPFPWVNRTPKAALDGVPGMAGPAGRVIGTRWLSHPVPPGEPSPACRPAGKNVLQAVACRHGAPLGSVPRLSEIPLPPPVIRTGCSFCATGGSGVPADPAADRDAVASGLRKAIGRSRRGRTIAVACAESSLDALAWAVENAGSLGIAPATIECSFGRPVLAPLEDDLIRLASACGAAGFAIRIGSVWLGSPVESDSRLFNMGGAEELRGTLDVLGRLRAGFPSPDPMEGSVARLLLFHPWQDIEGLRGGMAAVREMGIPGLFSSLDLDEIPLDPRAPLYHLAAKDGLVRPGLASANAEWRFENPVIALVHEIWGALAPRIADHAGLLEASISGALRSGDGRIDARRISVGVSRLSRMVRSRPFERAAGPVGAAGKTFTLEVTPESLAGIRRQPEALAGRGFRAIRLVIEARGLDLADPARMESALAGTLEAADGLGLAAGFDTARCFEWRGGRAG